MNSHSLHSPKPSFLTRRPIALAVVLVASSLSAAVAQSVPPAAPAKAASGAAVGQTEGGESTRQTKPASPPDTNLPKDVVLDRPAAAVMTDVTALISEANPVALTHRQTTMAGNVAELGLAMLRAQSEGATTRAETGNQVVSPASLVAALGLVHAGTAGDTANEISALVGPTSARGTVFQRDVPDLLKAVLLKGPELASANRIWIDANVAKAIPATYAAAVSQRYMADGGLLSFAKPQEARQTINAWAAQHTSGRIKQLLPNGALTPNSKIVLTNAMHFRSAWATAFSASATVDKPFQADSKTSKPVPTMVKRMSLRMGVVDNATVIDIPFDGDRFSLTVAMPPKGHTLNAFENDLSGHDIAHWARALPKTECTLELPKFKIEPTSVPLKAMLESLGVRSAFSDQADFTPLLGSAGKALALDNVFQSAGIAVDEDGAEASAATAAVVGVKSFARTTPVPVCAVNRPFVFAIMHRASGTPVFLGRVAAP